LKIGAPNVTQGKKRRTTLAAVDQRSAVSLFDSNVDHAISYPENVAVTSKSEPSIGAIPGDPSGMRNQAMHSAIAIAMRKKKALHKESDTSDEDADLWIGAVLDRNGMRSCMRRFLHFARGGPPNDAELSRFWVTRRSVGVVGGASMTSMPSWNLTPPITFGN
jgi:hypothetical protein